MHEVTAYGPIYSFGLAVWCCDDPDELLFETQAAYLARHGLLSPAERRARPGESTGGDFDSD